MAAKFKKVEDYQYIHMLACGANAEEMLRCKGLVEFCDKRQADKSACKAVREKNAKEKAERMANLNLILDKDKLPNLKGKNLQDQYALFKAKGAPNMQNIKKPTKVAEIREVLSDAIDSYRNRTWRPSDDDESNFEASDSMDEEESEEEWEDIEY